MEHYYYAQRDSYPLCFLVKNINADMIKKHYLDPYGIDPEDVLVLSLYQDRTKKKTSAADQREYINDHIVPVLNAYNVQYVAVCDADYFKTFAKQQKPVSMIGYVVNTSPFGPWNTVYVPNFQAVFYDPEKTTAMIGTSVKAIIDHNNAEYSDPGHDLPDKVTKYYDIAEIRTLLSELEKYDALSVDIEAFSLKPHTAGIGTIAFGVSENEAHAFPVDLGKSPVLVRKMLKRFFMNYKGRKVFHNISYDVMVLIYQLFMNDITDAKGQLEGSGYLLNNWDDTKIISYLATNSCAGNKLGLKDQSQEFAGNYAVEEIKDITQIPLDDLLIYNGIDCMATWYVYNKNYPIMVQDQQKNIYDTLFKDAIVDIIHMQLTGLPVDMERVLEVEDLLSQEHSNARDRVLNNIHTINYSKLRVSEIVIEKNNTYKKKRITAADVEYTFNINSDPQMVGLLFEHIGLPVLDKTDSGAPSANGKVLKSLLSHTEDQTVIDLLQALIDYTAVDKIITSFIPAIKESVKGKDGWHYLIGNFNLGGTVSGRLSSNNPNLQNLPAHGRLAKLIKSCFKAPPGWVLFGIDFSSLEDRISALTTKDPQKLSVYIDGYDGHCLRASHYFREEIGDIGTDVESINNIENTHPELRQKSKAPTFALTYQGTYRTLMSNCGFTEDMAKQIESRYRELYKVSIDYIDSRLKQACKDGYVTVAFGLRVRTPLLAQTVYGSRKTPNAAAAEGRTAGNAMGQSWCLLNSRAGSEVLKKVRSDKEIAHLVRPCAQIHDAQYYLVREDLSLVSWLNDAVVSASLWQDDPEIYHEEVGLGGEAFICYPDWGYECKLPNYASENDILNAVEKHLNKLEKISE